jgi:hypothetical protein
MVLGHRRRASVLGPESPSAPRGWGSLIRSAPLPIEHRQCAHSFSIYQPQADIQTAPQLTENTMTIPRLAIIAIACLFVVDMEFGNGRLVEAVGDQVTQLGYWLSKEFDSIARY